MNLSRSMFGYLSSVKAYAQNSTWATRVLMGIFLLTGFLLGWSAKERHDASQVIALEPLREQHSDFTFIHPLLSCRTEKKEFPEFRKLEHLLIDEVNDKKLTGDVEKVSIYFRELETGRWVGIGEDEKYSPASLLKIPILISYFKLAEEDPALLGKKLVLTTDEDWNTMQLSSSEEHAAAGVSYTINELLRFMIVDSDNNAAVTLFNNLDPEVFREIGRDLGISIPEVDLTLQSMSVRTFSLFFRVLYNSSYISRPLSERALTLMSESHFTGGIRKGIPLNVRITSKFGERALRSGGSIFAYQFHDCGIVYYPSRPYLFCVMTEGKNFDTLQNVVTDLAHITYEYMAAAE